MPHATFSQMLENERNNSTVGGAHVPRVASISPFREKKL